MYYKAQDLALNNEHDFHVAAILKRGKSIVKVGVNSSKTNPRFARRHRNGEIDFHLHAEMDVVRFAKPGDTVIVVRFSAAGRLTMAKPCKFCRYFLEQAGVTDIYYSDWDGKYQKLSLNELQNNERFCYQHAV